MSDFSEHPPPSLDSLAASLRRLEARVAKLEGGGLPVAETPAQPAELEAAAEDRTGAMSGSGPLVRVLSVAGVGCLALAGAFLLRSFTESGALSGGMGVGLGLAYAIAWIALADRVGARGALLQASVLGVVAVVIAYPLMWEASTRLAVLEPVATAALITATTAVGMFTAWRRRIRALAWAVTVATLVTALVLLYQSTQVEAFSVTLLCLAAITVWLSYARHWQFMRWVTAAAAYMCVILMVYLVAYAHGGGGRFDHLSIPLVQGLALGLVLVYPGSFALHTLVGRRAVASFEILNSVGALVVGFGGAVHVAITFGSGRSLLGAVALVAGAACYAVAFTIVEQHSRRGANFFYYAWMAIVLILLGGQLSLNDSALPYCWVLLAAIAAHLGGHYDRITLRGHCAVYLAAAAWGCGLIGTSIDALTATILPDWSWSQLLILASIMACYALLVTTQAGRKAMWLGRTPRLGVLLMWIIGGVGMLVLLLTRSFLGTSPDVVAVVRTGVLAASTIALAAAGRKTLLVEMSWLTYPLLIAGGLKLILEDLRHGQPTAVFIAFTCYGIALIVAPRLQRKAQAALS